MKLTLVSVDSINRPVSETTPIPNCALRVWMRGESGELYKFDCELQANIKVEDSIRRLADEIAATRRKRPRPVYKVKSLMPKGYFDRIKQSLDANSFPIQDFLRRAKKMSDELTFVYDPTQSYGHSLRILKADWCRATITAAKWRLREYVACRFPADAVKRMKIFVVKPAATAALGMGFVSWRIDPVTPTPIDPAKVVWSKETYSKASRKR